MSCRESLFSVVFLWGFFEASIKAARLRGDKDG